MNSSLYIFCLLHSPLPVWWHFGGLYASPTQNQINTLGLLLCHETRYIPSQTPHQGAHRPRSWLAGHTLSTQLPQRLRFAGSGFQTFLLRLPVTVAQALVSSTEAGVGLGRPLLRAATPRHPDTVSCLLPAPGTLTQSPACSWCYPTPAAGGPSFSFTHWCICCFSQPKRCLSCFWLQV